MGYFYCFYIKEGWVSQNLWGFKSYFKFCFICLLVFIFEDRKYFCKFSWMLIIYLIGFEEYIFINDNERRGYVIFYYKYLVWVVLV